MQPELVHRGLAFDIYKVIGRAVTARGERLTHRNDRIVWHPALASA